LSVVSCVVECWCCCLLIILFKLISRELSIFLGETRPRIPVRMWKYRSNVRVVVVVGFHTGRAHGGLFNVGPTDFFRGLFCRNEKNLEKGKQAQEVETRNRQNNSKFVLMFPSTSMYAPSCATMQLPSVGINQECFIHWRSFTCIVLPIWGRKGR
jgi:hypothetical protein